MIDFPLLIELGLYLQLFDLLFVDVDLLVGIFQFHILGRCRVYQRTLVFLLTSLFPMDLLVQPRLKFE